MKNYVKSNFPNLYAFLKHVYRTLFNYNYDSSKYWMKRYANGGNSGIGSYGEKAKEKASYVNKIIDQYHIYTLVDLGFGDGNQLALLNLKNVKYCGYDISFDAVTKLRQLYYNDDSKCFDLIKNYNGKKHDLALSMEVIFHLDNDNFSSYMDLLFKSSSKYVLIFSTNYNSKPDFHMIHHEIKEYVESNQNDYKLIDFFETESFKVHSISDYNSCFYLYSRV